MQGAVVVRMFEPQPNETKDPRPRRHLATRSEVRVLHQAHAQGLRRGGLLSLSGRGAFRFGSPRVG